MKPYLAIAFAAIVGVVCFVPFSSGYAPTSSTIPQTVQIVKFFNGGVGFMVENAPAVTYAKVFIKL